ncbi:MAG: alpha/beta hydrolase, partial [Terriglobales bacterium]
SKYTVVFSHGNGGNIAVREDTVSLLLKAGTSVFIYDYRGYGKSQGAPDVEGICEDAIAAYDYVHKVRQVPPEHIVLYGESLGVGVTTYLSTERKCAGMILQSGFASLSRIASEIFPVLALYPGPLLSNPPLDSIAVLSKSHAPVLIVHGRQDDVVPFKHGEDIYEAAVGPKVFVDLPACGHNDISCTAPAKYTEALKKFWGSLSESTAHNDHATELEQTTSKTL